MSADSKRRPASLTQASRSKFEKEVLRQRSQTSSFNRTAAVEESGFRPIQGGKEGEVKKKVLQ